jgi:hypothetical protein
VTQDFQLRSFQSNNAASAFGFGQRPNVIAGVDPVLTADPSES